MCHLILVLPFLVLPIFWLVPLAVSVPIYVVILALSIWMYWTAIKAMNWPVRIGREEIQHNRGEVVETDGNVLRVKLHNEIWRARSKDALAIGDNVEVVEVDPTTDTVSQLL